MKFHKSGKGLGWSLTNKAPKGYKLYYVNVEGKKSKRPRPVYYFEK